MCKKHRLFNRNKLKPRASPGAKKCRGMPRVSPLEKNRTCARRRADLGESRFLTPPKKSSLLESNLLAHSLKKNKKMTRMVIPPLLIAAKSRN